MSANSFGSMFRVTTFGESHGPGVGVVIDGCPPRLAITVEEIQGELDRRRPGQSAITTQRREAAAVQDLEVEVDTATVTRAAVDANIVRCPDAAMAAKMIARIDEARKAGDSLGGVVEAVARGVPPGLGEPVFDKLDAELAKAMLSL